MSEKPVKWVDQIAHGGIAFLIVLISAIPVISGIIGAFRFAVVREYYQAKITTIDVYKANKLQGKIKFFSIIKNMNWVKRDLVAAYVGILVGIPVAIWVFFWLLTRFMVTL